MVKKLIGIGVPDFKKKFDKDKTRAELEIAEEERKKKEEERKRLVEERTRKIKKEREEMESRVETEEKELADLKTKRMVECDVGEFIPKFKCKKCGKENKVYLTQRGDHIVIWSMCQNCEVEKEVKFEEARGLNNYIYHNKILLRQFLNFPHLINNLGRKDVFRYEKQKF